LRFASVGTVPLIEVSLVGQIALPSLIDQFDNAWAWSTILINFPELRIPR